MRSMRLLLPVAIVGCALATASLAEDPPAAPARPAQTAKAAPPSLDLTAPDIHRVLPRSDLEGPIPDLDGQDEDVQTVQVQSHQETEYVPGGIASLWWGLTHPTKAWRIFTPVQ